MFESAAALSLQGRAEQHVVDGCFYFIPTTARTRAEDVRVNMGEDARGMHEQRVGRMTGDLWVSAGQDWAKRGTT